MGSLVLCAALTACGYTGGAAPSVAAPLTKAVQHQGYGPRVPVGTQASITCPSGSVSLSAGANIQTAVYANPAGTAFCLHPGSYYPASLNLLAGDSLIGLQGAILDGQGTNRYLLGSVPTGVTIENLIVQNYDTPVGSGAAIYEGNLSYHGGPATNWVVKNNEVRNNGAAGIGSGGGDQITANYIHNNGQEGYKAFGVGATWTDNEIAYNNPLGLADPGVEAGGGKGWQTTNLTMAYNSIHDNYGQGISNDTDNVGTVIEYNDVERNAQSGISHEVSWNAVIDDNYLAYNGSSARCYAGSPWCADILIPNSGGVNGNTVDISGNVIVAGPYEGAILLQNYNRGTSTMYPSNGPWLCQNVKVHNNFVNLTSVGSSGNGAIDADGSDANMFTSQGNSFDYDSYTGSGARSFTWGPGKSATHGDFAFFQGQGLEAHGSDLK